MSVKFSSIVSGIVGSVQNKTTDWVAFQKRNDGLVGDGPPAGTPAGLLKTDFVYNYTRLLSVTWKSSNVLIFTFDSQPTGVGLEGSYFSSSRPGSLVPQYAIEVVVGADPNTIEVDFDDLMDNPTTWTVTHIDGIVFENGLSWIEPLSAETTTDTEAVESVVQTAPHTYIVTMTSNYVGDVQSTFIHFDEGIEPDTVTPVGSGDLTQFTLVCAAIDGADHTWSINNVSAITMENDRPIGPPYEGVVLDSYGESGTGTGSDPLPDLIMSVKADYGARVLAAGANPSKWFSTYTYSNPPVAPNIIENAGLWAKDLDLTCLSVMLNNWWAYAYMCSAALTRKHIATCMHFNPGTSTICFQLGDGSIISRNIVRYGMKTTGGIRIDTSPYPYLNERYADIAIGELDSELPVGVTIAKILPANWANYMANGGAGLPVILPHKYPVEAPPPYDKYLYGSNIRSGGLAGAYLSIASNYTGDRIAEVAAVGGDWIDRDSGAIAITHIGSQVVALCSAQGINGGPNYAYYSTDMQEVLNALGGGYSLSFADLSGYEVVA